MYAFLFDLDGVLVDTAKYHYLAWRAVCNQLGFDLSYEENEKLKGIDRVTSLNILLNLGKVKITQNEFEEWLLKKNQHYLNLIGNLAPEDLFEGALSLFKELKKRGIKIGLGSASKNARYILDKLQITSYFDYIVEGTMTTRGKPDPQVFLIGAKGCNVNPENCAVFEDAEAGVEAAITGNMKAIGIGDKKILKDANLVYPHIKDVDLESVLRLFRE
jgi:beta-phosphoglucomutase